MNSHDDVPDELLWDYLMWNEYASDFFIRGDDYEAIGFEGSTTIYYFKPYVTLETPPPAFELQV